MVNIWFFLYITIHQCRLKTIVAENFLFCRCSYFFKCNRRSSLWTSDTIFPFINEWVASLIFILIAFILRYGFQPFTESVLSIILFRIKMLENENPNWEASLVFYVVDPKHPYKNSAHIEPSYISFKIAKTLSGSDRYSWWRNLMYRKIQLWTTWMNCINDVNKMVAMTPSLESLS